MPFVSQPFQSLFYCVPSIGNHNEVISSQLPKAKRIEFDFGRYPNLGFLSYDAGALFLWHLTSLFNKLYWDVLQIEQCNHYIALVMDCNGAGLERNVRSIRPIDQLTEHQLSSPTRHLSSSGSAPHPRRISLRTANRWTCKRPACLLEGLRSRTSSSSLWW